MREIQGDTYIQLKYFYFHIFIKDMLNISAFFQDLIITP
jgi:hypothetical protein